jgi:hypothetical protein
VRWHVPQPAFSSPIAPVAPGLFFSEALRHSVIMDAGRLPALNANEFAGYCAPRSPAQATCQKPRKIWPKSMACAIVLGE